jgi:hypothetical protein
MSESIMKHPLHSICPYFAMFPESFVTKQLLAYTSVGDWVFDPFSGRGTTVFESLLNGRQAAGTDINPVAACVAGAKAEPPQLDAVYRRLDELIEQCAEYQVDIDSQSEFFRACFHSETLRQLLCLRGCLDWQGNVVDRFIAAVALGCLHGESHKSPNCFSNRMPRTISTKPDYSVRWWAARALDPPQRDVFSILSTVAAFRLSRPVPELRGTVMLADARHAAATFPSLEGNVSLVVTSPPYLDTTDFREDQWLRLWFLGGPERPEAIQSSDDRYTNIARYWTFLTEAWAGCAALFRSGTVIVVRLGGTRVTKDILTEGLFQSLETGLGNYRVSALQDATTSEIRNRQTNAFRPGTTTKRFEHDFVFELT